jgi:hypothetical protein
MIVIQKAKGQSTQGRTGNGKTKIWTDVGVRKINQQRGSSRKEKWEACGNKNDGWDGRGDIRQDAGLAVRRSVVD